MFTKLGIKITLEATKAPLRTQEHFALAYEQQESIPMRAALNTFWDAIQRFLKRDPVQRQSAIGEQFIQYLVGAFLALGTRQLRTVSDMAEDADCVADSLRLDDQLQSVR